jgi:hypothetical protein
VVAGPLLDHRDVRISGLGQERPLHVPKEEAAFSYISAILSARVSGNRLAPAFPRINESSVAFPVRITRVSHRRYLEIANQDV